MGGQYLKIENQLKRIDRFMKICCVAMITLAMFLKSNTWSHSDDHVNLKTTRDHGYHEETFSGFSSNLFAIKIPFSLPFFPQHPRDRPFST